MTKRYGTFADLNFNIISKENLEFYMNNKDVLDSNNNILSNYNLTNYIEDEYYIKNI